MIASGARREKRVGELVGGQISRADPDFVRASTGFAIGGIPPVGHKTEPIVFIDEDLLQRETIWAAAGTRLAGPEQVEGELWILAETDVDVARQDPWAGVALTAGITPAIPTRESIALKL